MSTPVAATILVELTITVEDEPSTCEEPGYQFLTVTSAEVKSLDVSDRYLKWLDQELGDNGPGPDAEHLIAEAIGAAVRERAEASEVSK